MRKLLIASAMVLSIGGTSAIAAPNGTFKQATNMAMVTSPVLTQRREAGLCKSQKS